MGYLQLSHILLPDEFMREPAHNKAFQSDQLMLSRLLLTQKTRQHSLAAEERRWRSEMDPVTTIAGLAAIAAWIQVLQAEKKRLTDKQNKAIDAICEAVDLTRKYIAVTKPPIGKGKDKRNPKEEQDLSNKWERAGSLLFAIDFELAQRCSIKSGFWQNPQGKKWKSAHSELASIKLKDIAKAANELRKGT